MSMAGPTPIRVLCVDDHPVVRTGLRALIEHEPDLELIAAASTAAEAHALATALHPDLLLIDVRLPDGDGIDAAAILRRHMPGLRILVLSTFAGDETVHRALDAGASGFVLKEHAEADLIDAVRAVAAGKRYMPRAVSELLLMHGPRVALTPREHEVLRAMARGLNSRDIARALRIAEATARTHVENVRAKFKCRDKQTTIVTATTRGFLT